MACEKENKFPDIKIWLVFTFNVYEMCLCAVFVIAYGKQ